MLKAIIADDNKCERMILRKFLNRFSDMVSVEAEVENGTELMEAATRLHPQIVFIDIDMPQTSGIEAAMEISDINPQTYIVFVTAHSSFMKEAFDVYAFDYLTKPINFERLEKTVHRIIGHTSGNTDASSLHKDLRTSVEEMQHDMTSSVRILKDGSRIMIQTGENVVFKGLGDIVMITRNNRKTDICTRTGTVKTNESLERLENLLGERFFRCHKGYIINTEQIRELVPWGKKTLMVRFENYDDTALMTMEKFKAFKTRYCME